MIVASTTGLETRRSTHRHVLIGAVGAACVGAGSVAPLWLLGADSAAAASATMHVLVLGFAAFLLIKRAARSDPRMRRARLFLAASVLAAAGGSLIGAGYIAIYGTAPVPSLADPVSLAWVPLAAYGFWLVPTFDGAKANWQRLIADGALSVSSLLLISWILVLQPIIGGSRASGFGEAVQLAYPISDVFIAAVVLALLPRVRADLRVFLNCVAIALTLVAVSDSGAAIGFVRTGKLSFGWPDLTLQAAFALLVFSALVQMRPVVRARRVTITLDFVLPYLPVLLAVVVGLRYIWQGRIFGLDKAVLAAIMIIAVVSRQLLFVKDLTDTAEQSREAATHDALTGLSNRSAFIARLDEHTSTPGASAAAVVLADLDGFKEVNDSLGHDAGDRVLRDFADILSAAAGDQMVARLGGDEFAVLVEANDPEVAAKEIAQTLARSEMPSSSGLTIACSSGIATFGYGESVPDILRRADLAMYSAKRAVGESVAVYESAMAARFERRHLLIAQLSGATARGEMRLVYQPLYRLRDGALCGAEALLRWTHPFFGAIPPDEFIPLAEDSGAIREIGSWVIDAALRQVGEWDSAGCILPSVFVNVSAVQFTDALSGEVLECLRVNDLDPSRLILEITESQVPDLTANRAMRVLREAGVRTALDDFGSGYSSLAQLASLPVDILKIDRDFILNLEESAGRAVVDAVVSLAKALGLETIAEGVEDIGQAAEIVNAGIDFVQGYLFSRPLPADEMTNLLTGSEKLASIGLPLPRAGDHDLRSEATATSGHGEYAGEAVDE